MSNTDFDPDAYLTPAPASPEATPAPAGGSEAPGAFNPDAFLAAPAKPAGGFDPDAYLATPAWSDVPPDRLSQAEGMVTDIPHQIYRAGSQALSTLNRTFNPWSAEGAADRDAYLKDISSRSSWDITPQLKRTLDVGKGVFAAPAAVVAPITGTARAVIGHGFEAASPQFTPEEKAKLAAAGVQPTTGEEAADLAMSGMRPYGMPVKTLPGAQGPAPPLMGVTPKPYEIRPTVPSWSWDKGNGAMPPTAPATPPLGVTLSEGEQTGNLAQRVAEQRFLRQGSEHAQAWQEQRAGQLAEAPHQVTPQFDPLGQNVVRTPQAAADIVQSALDRQHTSAQNAITQQADALDNTHNALHAKLSPTGTVLASSPMEAADIASGAVAAEAERAQAGIDAAYKQFRELPGQFHPAAFNKIGEKIESALARGPEPIRIDPQLTPQASGAARELDSILGDLRQTRDPDTGRVLPHEPVTPSLVEYARRRINSYYGSAKQAARVNQNWSDVRATRALVDAFDAQVQDRIKKGTFTGGDPAAVSDALSKARAQYSAYRDTFTPRGPGDTVGQAIQKILGRYEGSAATPEETRQILYGANGSRVGQRLISMFGPDSEVVGAAKQGLYSHITEPPAGAKDWGPAKVADRIDAFTRGAGRSLTETYLSPSEIAELRSYGQQLRSHAATVDAYENPFEGKDFNALFRQAINQNQNAVQTIDEAVRRLGPTSTEATAARQGLFLRAVQPVEDVAQRGPKVIGDNLANLLAATRNSQIYSQPQRAAIKSYMDLMRKITMPANTYAPSGPEINRLMSVVGYRVGQVLGAIIGRSVTPGVPLVGEFAGITIGGKIERALEGRLLSRVQKQLPLVTEQMDKYQRALNAYNKRITPLSRAAVTAGAANLAHSLQPLGIELSKIPGVQLPGMAPAEEKEPPKRADGGMISDDPEADNWGNYMGPNGRPRITITPPDTTAPTATPGAGALATTPLDTLPQPNPAATADNAPAFDPDAYLATPTQPPAQPDAAALPDQPAPGPDPFAATPESEAQRQAVINAAGSTGSPIADKLTGLGGQQRYQLWPERMVRSGFTLPHDVITGQVPIRDNYGNVVDVQPATAGAVPSEAVIQRAQDLAGMQVGASIPTTAAEVLPKATAALAESGRTGAPLAALEHQPFYSAVQRAVKNAPQQKMSGQQWLGWLRNQPGVKQEELGWLGLDDTFSNAKSVPKEQLLQHINDHNVQLKEVEKGGTPVDPDTAYEQAVEHVQENYPQYEVDSPAYERLVNDTYEELSSQAGGIPHYSDYQLPGGDNYRELLLTMPPSKEALDSATRSLTSGRVIDFNRLEPHRQAEVRERVGNLEGNYYSSHWDEPNVLAHMRMNDRNIPDVGKSLHLEEVQSDLHQAGRKHGYQHNYTLSDVKERKGPAGDAQYYVEIPEQFGGRTLHQDTPEDAVRAANRVTRDSRPVPDAPFKTTWADLALKRAIAKAAREGYDAISWTPGEQQAARYALSKQVSKVQYHPESRTLWVTQPSRSSAPQQLGHYSPEKLPDVLGKEAADRLLKSDKNREGFHVLEGQDLKVGGEGMKAFYDKMLVDKANALGKKYGAKVEWNPLETAEEIDPRSVPTFGLDPAADGKSVLYYQYPNGEAKRIGVFSREEAIERGIKFHEEELEKARTKVPVLRLTPQLKEQALKGLPLFAESGRAGAPLTGARNKQDQRDIPGPEQQQPGQDQEDVTQRAAGGAVNTQPSEAQASAGNYAKAHRWVQGLNITVENPKGSVRRGIDSNGKGWKAELPCAYGYIRGFGKAADGDHPDVFVGPHTSSPHVFIIDQIDLKTGKFDEHKVLLGMGSETQAINFYKRAFSDGKAQARIGAIHHLTMAEFKNWLEHGDLEQPFEEPETKKHTHASVNYTPHSTRPNKHCGNCRNYVPPELNGPACVGVKSPIDPAGWCNRFRPRSV